MFRATFTAINWILAGLGLAYTNEAINDTSDTVTDASQNVSNTMKYITIAGFIGSVILILVQLKIIKK